jgi:hypothetical protein
MTGQSWLQAEVGRMMQRTSGSPAKKTVRCQMVRAAVLTAAEQLAAVGQHAQLQTNNSHHPAAVEGALGWLAAAGLCKP